MALRRLALRKPDLTSFFGHAAKVPKDPLTRRAATGLSSNAPRRCCQTLFSRVSAPIIVQLIEVAPHVCEIGDGDLPLCGNAMPGRTPIHVSLQRKLLVVAILDQHLPQALGRYAGRKSLGSARDGLTAPQSSSSLFSRSAAHHFRRSRRRYPSREGHRRIQPAARSAVFRRVFLHGASDARRRLVSSISN